ncbi:MAG: low molecular weight protein arginine phosphatase [bacterium]|nr:low molecular weight protein arginine phosphatase [bacterium]
MKILFVCTGNTCRSPLAEKLFGHYTKDCSGVESASAGISAWQNVRMSFDSERLLILEGIDPSGFRSQPVTEKLLDKYDLILTMGQKHVDYITGSFPKVKNKTFLLKKFVNKDVLDPEVADPYLGNADAYENCFREIKEAVIKLKERLCV